MNNRWKDRGWQWRREFPSGGCIVLDVWRKREFTRKNPDGTTTLIPLFEGWQRTADVFPARRGDRWVIKMRRSGKSHGFITLREAMRMAVFLTQLGVKQ